MKKLIAFAFVASILIAAAPDPQALKVQGPDSIGTPLLAGYSNGSTIESAQGSQSITLLGSATRTATTESATQTNTSCHGLIVYLNVTAASGTGGLQIRLKSVDPVSLTHVASTSLPTAIIATGEKIYWWHPNASGSGNPYTATAAASLPRTWTVEVVHGDASNYTYSVAVDLIP